MIYNTISWIRTVTNKKVYEHLLVWILRYFVIRAVLILLKHGLKKHVIDMSYPWMVELVMDYISWSPIHVKSAWHKKEVISIITIPRFYFGVSEVGLRRQNVEVNAICSPLKEEACYYYLSILEKFLLVEDLGEKQPHKLSSDRFKSTDVIFTKFDINSYNVSIIMMEERLEPFSYMES